MTRVGTVMTQFYRKQARPSRQIFHILGGRVRHGSPTTCRPIGRRPLGCAVTIASLARVITVMTVMTPGHYQNELIFSRLGCPGGMAHPNSISHIPRAQLCHIASPDASTMTVHCTNIRHSKCHYSRTCNDAGFLAKLPKFSNIRPPESTNF